jgi:hypothetical protein
MTNKHPVANVAAISPGSTRVARVQFGVAPNCVGVRALAARRTTNHKLRPATVSGATPETTRATRVLP